MVFFLSLSLVLLENKTFFWLIAPYHFQYIKYVDSSVLLVRVYFCCMKLYSDVFIGVCLASICASLATDCYKISHTGYFGLVVDLFEFGKWKPNPLFSSTISFYVCLCMCVCVVLVGYSPDALPA